VKEYESSMKKLLIILGALGGLAAALMGLGYFLRKLEAAAEDETEDEYSPMFIPEHIANPTED
jgi:hypothetical protein